MKRIVLVASILAAAASPCWGSALFGLFSSQDYTSCNLAIPPGETGTFYVVAVDATDPILCGPGLSGAALRIDGLPLDWTATVTVAPGAASWGGVGDGLLGDAAFISFWPARLEDYILLYTVSVTPAGPEASAVLQVVKPVGVAAPYDCPTRTGPADCLPDFDVACVDGGILYINTPGDCIIGVETSTWSQVKHLYN